MCPGGAPGWSGRSSVEPGVEFAVGVAVVVAVAVAVVVVLAMAIEAAKVSSV